jgi:NADPH:quinone reductase-like Zn-dependent oxidoreductase
MRAVVIAAHGDPDVIMIEERPVPEPGPGQVLVKMEAAALNHLDLWVRRGIPGVKYPLPMVPGTDLAGVVEAVGPGVTGIEPGLPMMAAPGVSCGRCGACSAGDDNLCRWYGIIGETCDGGCQEYVVLPAANVLPRPANITAEEGAAIPLTFLTAWHMLVARAGIRPGQDVLIHAAGSGVGAAAIQIAKLWGCRVIATTGTDAKLEKMTPYGIDVPLNYKTQDWMSETRRVTGKRGVDVVIDHVGADTMEKSVACLATGGCMVTCGTTSGAEIRLNFRRIFFKNLSVIGSTMGSRAEYYEILKHVASGRLRAVIDRVLPLEQCAEAHRVLENREAVGKVVLVP